MERSMLKIKVLNNSYWYYIVDTIMYILNKYFTIALHKKTPYESLYDTKPTISHLIIFGFTQGNVNGEVRKNLDPKNNTCILVGYFETRHIGYIIQKSQACSI